MVNPVNNKVFKDAYIAYLDNAVQVAKIFNNWVTFEKNKELTQADLMKEVSFNEFIDYELEIENYDAIESSFLSTRINAENSEFYFNNNKKNYNFDAYFNGLTGESGDPDGPMNQYKIVYPTLSIDGLIFGALKADYINIRSDGDGFYLDIGANEDNPNHLFDRYDFNLGFRDFPAEGLTERGRAIGVVMLAVWR